MKMITINSSTAQHAIDALEHNIVQRKNSQPQYAKSLQIACDDIKRVMQTTPDLTYTPAKTPLEHFKKAIIHEYIFGREKQGDILFETTIKAFNLNREQFNKEILEAIK